MFKIPFSKEDIKQAINDIAEGKTTAKKVNDMINENYHAECKNISEETKHARQEIKEEFRRKRQEIKEEQRRARQEPDEQAEPSKKEKKCKKIKKAKNKSKRKSGCLGKLFKLLLIGFLFEAFKK